MAKLTYSSVSFLIFSAFLSVIPRLSAADATPSASPVNDNAALVAKINSLYYNYKHLGLHKFKCEVKVSMFDKILEMMKSKYKDDDARLKAIKDVRFFINYDEKDGFKFNYSNYKPTGDPKTDSSVAKILDGSGKIVDGFWTSWKSMTFEPAIDTTKATVTVNKTPGGYEILEKKDPMESTNIFNEDLMITEVDGRKTDKPDVVVTIKPAFLKTTDGFLMNSAEVEMAKSMVETLTIEYQDVTKYKMPAKANIAMEIIGSVNTNISLVFSNYQLN